VFLEADFGGHTINLGAIAMNEARLSDSWKWLAVTTGVIRTVAADIGQPAPRMSIAAVHDAWQECMVMCALAGQATAMIDLDAAEGIPTRFGSLLAYCPLTIGEMRIEVVASRPIVLDQTKRRRRQIYFGPAQVLYGAFRRGGDESRMIAAYRRHLQRLSRSAEVLALGDLRRITTDAFSDSPLQIDRPY
jgi:hypothetical protein